MARRRIDIRMDVKLLARIDAESKRLGQTRTMFVERALEFFLSDPVKDLMPRPNGALESALGGVEEFEDEASEHSSLDHSVSAPVRAPVVEPDAFAAGEVMDRASAFRAATGR